MKQRKSASSLPIPFKDCQSSLSRKHGNFSEDDNEGENYRHIYDIVFYWAASQNVKYDNDVIPGFGKGSEVLHYAPTQLPLAVGVIP